METAQDAPKETQDSTIHVPAINAIADNRQYR